MRSHMILGRNCGASVLSVVAVMAALQVAAPAEAGRRVTPPQSMAIGVSSGTQGTTITSLPNVWSYTTTRRGSWELWEIFRDGQSVRMFYVPLGRTFAGIWGGNAYFYTSGSSGSWDVWRVYENDAPMASHTILFERAAGTPTFLGIYEGDAYFYETWTAGSWTHWEIYRNNTLIHDIVYPREEERIFYGIEDGDAYFYRTEPMGSWEFWSVFRNDEHVREVLLERYKYEFHKLENGNAYFIDRDPAGPFFTRWEVLENDVAIYPRLFIDRDVDAEFYDLINGDIYFLVEQPGTTAGLIECLLYRNQSQAPDRVVDMDASLIMFGLE